MRTQRIMVEKHSTDFREATRIVDAELPEPTKDTVIVRNTYAGINATDINHINGVYMSQLPNPCGFDGIGVVEAVGPDVKAIKVGDAVAYVGSGAFAYHTELPESTAVKVDKATPDMVPLFACGTCASMALEYAGEMKSGETVLVTAAAGGTGQIAVQLAKLAGNHVIGTCSSAEKVELLKSLGCDRVINYKEENVGEVLKKEYPNGLNLVFESVGGEQFRAAAENIAVRGRIILFGIVSSYKDGFTSQGMMINELAPLLLFRSAHVRGFLGTHYWEHIGEHTSRLVKLAGEGKLKPGLDSAKFEGLEQVADALDYMYARKNKGKLVVKMSDP